ncbi:hypothetical protein [Thermovirga sp.]|uniref:hypothetical protein n=1 Tax=Thermovirga sp. TaxID=2699834 RepID=UPI0025F606DA|nr:hypothetical protein [Thermovirga sp.]MBO8153955.1 hypothetical protein [Thermovirga sp.]
MGIFRFLLFALLFFVVFVIYAFIDHKRLKNKAKKYLSKKLGLYNTPFEMTRYVRMARIVQEENRTFMGVFPIHDRHISLKDFMPKKVFDVPPDGVILGDDDKNSSYIFLDRDGKLHYGKIEGFLPELGGYVRRGARSVVFGVPDLPGSIKDWFVVDRQNEKTLFPRHDDGTGSLQSSFFYLLNDFIPSVGDIVNDKGAVILLDQSRGAFAIRENFGEDFKIYRGKDIERVELLPDGYNNSKPLLVISLRGAKDALSVGFDYENEAHAWSAKMKELKEESTGEGSPKRVFLRLLPVPVSSL